MVFTSDTEVALRSAVHLINTMPGLAGPDDALASLAALDAFVTAEQFSGSRERSTAELAAVQAMREELWSVWRLPADAAVPRLNALLAAAAALPQLVRHDGLDWHLHATPAGAPLAQRMGVEAAMALVDVVRGQEWGRLKVCAGEDCRAVLVDLSKNRSRQYCTTGNCANRAHVAAYRQRKGARSE